MKKLVFSKEKFIEVEGIKTYENNKEWVDLCDSKSLSECAIMGFVIVPELCIEVEDEEDEYQPKHAKDKVQKHKELCEVLNNTYKLKNERYGDSFGISVKKYGLISALTRISDKFNRFEQLVLEKTDGTNDESLLDTCLDAANYFIMTAMELQGETNED